MTSHTWLVGSLVIRVIVDADPPVSRQKIAVTKKLESNHHVNKQKLNDKSSIDQMVIR